MFCLNCYFILCYFTVRCFKVCCSTLCFFTITFFEVSCFTVCCCTVCCLICVSVQFVFVVRAVFLCFILKFVAGQCSSVECFVVECVDA